MAANLAAAVPPPPAGNPGFRGVFHFVCYLKFETTLFLALETFLGFLELSSSTTDKVRSVAS